MSILSLLILLSLALCTFSTDIFESVPETQYVYVNRIATFECSTSQTGYILSFAYTASVDVNLTVNDLTVGGSKQIITEFTVTREVNGSTVRCFATNITNSEDIEFTSIAYAYAQDLPAAVGNLNVEQNDSCTIIIEWDPPFTFIGLSVYYLITISIGEDEIIFSEEVYTNNYTFYPTSSSNGLYVIEVTSMNDVGTSGKTTTNFSFEKDNVIQNLVLMNDKTFRNSNIWTYHFNLTSFPSCSVPIKETTVISCIDVNDQTTCHNASSKYNNVTVNETSSSVISTMDLPPNYKFSTCVVFEYISGLIFESTVVTISTHDLQDLKVHIIDELCLKFVIVNGAELSTVYLILECNNRDVEAYEVSRPNDTLVFTQCLSNIPSNNWTLYACDGDPLQDVSTCTSNPAVRLYGIVITPSSSSTGMSSNIISEWTESTFLTSVSSVSAVISIMPTFQSSPSQNSGLIVGTTVGVVVLLLLFITFAILTYILYSKKIHQIYNQRLKQVDQQRVCERPPTYENILTNPPVDFKTNLKEDIHSDVNVDINPCYDSVQSNNQKTRMTMNPSYETVQNSTSDQLHIQTRQESHYENVNP